MAEILINMDMDGYNNDFFEMQEALVKLQKTLFWLFGHLDSMNVRSLSTNETTIKSTDGTTHLDGSQLKMYDSSKRLRLVMGYNPGTDRYEFSMFNKNGDETLLIDNDGDAIFKGTVSGSKIIGTQIEGGKITGTEIVGGTIEGADITATSTVNVGTDATVGKTLRLKDGTVTGGTLSIYDGTTPTLLLRGEGSRDVRISTNGRIELVANGGVVDSTGKRYLTENSVNGSFTTNDGKTVVVESGMVKSIN